jgi:hypothetical protein
MNRKKKIFLMLLALLPAAFVIKSCIPPPIDLGNIDPHEPRLVISSQIIPNSIMVVAVSRSFSALEGASEEDTVQQDFLDEILVDRALVVVKYMNQTDTLYRIAPGLYGSLTVLQYSYGTYELYVKDSITGLEATSTSVLLPLVPFDTINPVVTRTSTDTTVSVKYQVSDPPGISNWYVVNFFVKRTDTTSAGIDMYSYFNSGNKNTYFELFTDQEFDGTVYTAETRLEDVNGTDTIAVAISNISSGYYEFLTAFKRAGSLVNQLTGEPINYPTNVQGGYGYFNTHYPDVRIFDLNQY